MEKGRRAKIRAKCPIDITYGATKKNRGVIGSKTSGREAAEKSGRSSKKEWRSL